jgi:hypothetical protein
MDNKPKLSLGKLWKVCPARDYFGNCRNSKRRQTERCLRGGLHFIFPSGIGAHPTLDLLRNSPRSKYRVFFKFHLVLGVEESIVNPPLVQNVRFKQLIRDP